MKKLKLNTENCLVDAKDGLCFYCKEQKYCTFPVGAQSYGICLDCAKEATALLEQQIKKNGIIQGQK